MPAPLSAESLLEQSFLELRARLLDVGAGLDRIERAGTVEYDPRWQQLQDGMRILLDQHHNRAERIQLLFSDDYVPNWNR